MTTIADFFLRYLGALALVVLGMLALHGLVGLVLMLVEPPRGRLR